MTQDERHRVLEGDAIEWLEQLGEDYVDAIVTDPPYCSGAVGRSVEDASQGTGAPIFHASTARMVRRGQHDDRGACVARPVGRGSREKARPRVRIAPPGLGWESAKLWKRRTLDAKERVAELEATAKAREAQLAEMRERITGLKKGTIELWWEQFLAILDEFDIPKREGG